MGMSATNGSQLWDLGFITQALVESGLAKTEEPSTQDSVIRALQWIDRCQILENPKVSDLLNGSSACHIDCTLDRFPPPPSTSSQAIVIRAKGLGRSALKARVTPSVTARLRPSNRSFVFRRS
jgi:hypothetical protein